MAAFSSASHGIDLLPPERTRAARPAPMPRRMTDVVDADFEVVPTPRGARPAHGETKKTFPPSSAPLLHRIEQRLHEIPPRAFAGMTLALCLAAFAFAASLAPTASPSALGFGTVKTEIQDADGLKVMAIYGTVVNPTAVAQEIPPIRIDVAAAGRQMSADAQIAGRRMLAPGESRPFSARVPQSGGSAPIVQISFIGAGASSR